MAALARLSADAFPVGTPLRAFFAWNEARRRVDRRYRILCRLHGLLAGGDEAFALAYLVGDAIGPWPVSGLRRTAPTLLSAGIFLGDAARAAALDAAQGVLEALRAAIGSADTALHAAMFRTFEALATHVDLASIARIEGCSIGAAKVRLFRARQRVRQILESDNE